MDPVSLERRRLLPSSSLVNNARLIVNVLLLFAPFCGWLSDTKIGRGNAIYLGLWLGWIVLLLLPNILPYGIDQLMNESTVKIRAFIHWFWLCLYSGYQRFEHIPIPNPYKIVFKVLKFFLKTSRTRRQHRSAFTYWGEEPSRMDLAKERYGGYFSHEEVENVKTFLRIAAVLATASSLFVSAFPFIFHLSDFTAQFKHGSKENARDAIWIFGNVVPLFVLVPLFELVILPLFPKLEYFLINPLKGLGLAYVLIILSIVSVFLIDLIGRIVADSDSNMPCFFIWEPVHQTIDISYWILLIPSVLAGASYFFTWISLFEFLCSQSPFARWYVNRVRDIDLCLRAAVEEHWENRLMAGSTINDNDTEDLWCNHVMKFFVSESITIHYK
uniref:Uncharacterized protein n=1 Tax=Amphimedon queenslandica TaxID=400682 RepID=A0A1X7TV23_AMPQE